MISNQDLYKEITTIEEVIKDEKDAYKRASLKSQVLAVKLLHNLRTNSVRMMEKFGIERIKPIRRDEETRHDEEKVTE